MVQWHKDGLMPADIWPGASGAKWKNAGDMFINGDVAMHIAGSWMIQKYVTDVGSKFEWIVAPGPCGPAGCSAMPGGAAMVAFKGTKHPAEVGKVMEFMVSEPILKEYYERTVQIPAHKGIAEKGLTYGKEVTPAAQAALKQFTDRLRQDPAAGACAAGLSAQRRDLQCHGELRRAGDHRHADAARRLQEGAGRDRQRGEEVRDVQVGADPWSDPTTHNDHPGACPEIHASAHCEAQDDWRTIRANAR